MIASHRDRHRSLAVAVSAALLVAVAASAALVIPRPSVSPGASGGASPAIALVSTAAGTPSPSWSPSPLLVPGTGSLAPSAEESADPAFPPLDLFVTPSPAPAYGALPADPSTVVDLRRPLPAQSTYWLMLKAAGRIALVDGQVTVLPIGSDPLVNPSTGLPVPDARTLDTDWTRWVVEPFGYGTDEMGNLYTNLSYWNLCGDGAMTVALWYWQQLTGVPNVTGMTGYFLEPYESEAVSWPDDGPEIAVARSGLRLGTYWSGSDDVSGFTAHGRGFVMYLAMVSRPATWKSAGLSVFARNGHPLYPTYGTPRTNIQAGLNWEVSGHNATNWAESYYASVIRPDATLARDLTAAVMLDVGRDGVPVIGAVDGYNLPNWQDGPDTPHLRHAIAIVGYDNTANPPTFTYIDTCGFDCNARGGNDNGQIHVISQSNMVLAIQNVVGSGFVW